MIAPNKDYPLHLPGTEITIDDFCKALEYCKKNYDPPAIINLEEIEKTYEEMFGDEDWWL